MAKQYEDNKSGISRIKQADRQTDRQTKDKVMLIESRYEEDCKIQLHHLK